MNPQFELDLLGLRIADSLVVSAAITLVLALVFAFTSRTLRVDGLGIWQTIIEMFTGWIESTVGEIIEDDPSPYVPVIGTLMLFIANLLSVVPVVRPPTADINVSAALALVVFLAVPYFGIRRHGLWGYLRTYVRPHPLLLPLNLVGELSRTLALAIRLFGNMMSAQMIGAILVLVAGLFLPVPLLALGILTALVQAYIFGVLAAVFIAAAVQVENRGDEKEATA